MFEIELFKNNSSTIILTPFILTFILGVFYSSFMILDEKYQAMERKFILLLKNTNEKIENLEKQLRKERENEIEKNLSYQIKIVENNLESVIEYNRIENKDIQDVIIKQVENLEKQLKTVIQYDISCLKKKLESDNSVVLDLFMNLEKKVNFSFKLIEYGTLKTNCYLNNFVINNSIDIYKYDKNMFCQVLATHWERLCATHGPDEHSRLLFKFFFFELSFEELDWIFKKSANLKYPESESEAELYKLNFLRPFIVYSKNYLKNLKCETQNKKNIFIQKSYKIYSTANCDYSKKKELLLNASESIEWFHEAQSILQKYV